jgi:TolB-like protein
MLPVLLVMATAAALQCPDGAPPPCAAARRAAAHRQPPAAAVRARRFLLLPFRNVTRAEPQEWLVTGAPLMLADAFGQFRELTVVPDEQITAARRRLGIAADAAASAAQLRRLAEETGGWTAVTGNVIATGGALRISAQAIDASTGAVLQRAEVPVVEGADVRAAFDRLAGQLLEVAGVTAATSDVAALTTRSLDAYRAYVRGLQLLKQSQFKSAAAAFTDAVRLDSSFALAWARLAMASTAWNIAAIANPLGPGNRAAERASALAVRLPPRVAAMVRGQTAFFRGEISMARAISDSLVRTDDGDLDGREFRAMLEMIDPTMAPGPVPRLNSSPNRTVAMTRELLERDPGRRYLYSAMGYVYGIAAGLWGGRLLGVRHEGGSIASLILGPTDQWFVPVLRDSFEVMTDTAFNALPAAEQERLRRGAADAGAAWVHRWLAAGPDDAEAYLWASRLAEYQDSLAQALRYVEAAESRHVESEMENVTGRRLMLMVKAGQVSEAGALAESLAVAHALRPSFAPMLDRGFNAATAALLLTRRFARAAEVAGPLDQGGVACSRWVGDLRAGTSSSLPDGVVWPVLDSVTAHVAELAALDRLRPCLRQLLLARRRPPAAARASALRLWTAADSMAGAGAGDPAFTVALTALDLDVALLPGIAASVWFAEREQRLSLGVRFRPASVVVEGDSVTFTWSSAEAGPFSWDYPQLEYGWGFMVHVPMPAAENQTYHVEAAHRWRARQAPATGGVRELVADMNNRSVSATRATGELRAVSGSSTATDDGFRVVVRGDLASALQRSARPETALFEFQPCPNRDRQQGGCQPTAVRIEYR